MGKMLGIDLGATYSRFAHIDMDGKANLLDNAEGELDTLTAVYFDYYNEAVVGRTALLESAMDPENLITDFIKYLGDESYKVKALDSEYSAEDLASYVFAKIVSDVSAFSLEDIDGAAVTCSAKLGEKGKKALKAAAERAGLKKVTVVGDVAAKAVAYRFSETYKNLNEFEKTVLMFDLGGSTFNCSVVKISAAEEKRTVKVETFCNACCDFGGNEWSNALKLYGVRKFCELTGCDEEEVLTDPETVAWFAENIEKAIKRLSFRDATYLIVPSCGTKERFEITREKFEEMTRVFLIKTVETAAKLLSDNKIDTAGIDEIVLAGGGCRMPQVKAEMEKAFGKPVYCEKPEEMAAKGAALLANGYKCVEAEDKSDLIRELTSDKADR